MRNWYCGIKSGIPLCCITFYVSVWKLIIRRRAWWFEYNKKAAAFYVRCPWCILTGRKVRVKRCDHAKCGKGFCSYSKQGIQGPDGYLRGG